MHGPHFGKLCVLVSVCVSLGRSHRVCPVVSMLVSLERPFCVCPGISVSP